MSGEQDFDFRDLLGDPLVTEFGGKLYKPVIAVSWARNTMAAVRIPFEFHGDFFLTNDDQLTSDPIDPKSDIPDGFAWDVADRFPPEEFKYILGGGAEDPDLVKDIEAEKSIDISFDEKVVGAFEAITGTPILLLERRAVEDWASSANPAIHILASAFARPKGIKALYAAAETGLYFREKAKLSAIRLRKLK